MNYTWFYSIISTLVISLVSLIGLIVIGLSQKLTKNRLLNLVSLSAGGMLGGAFFHLLPESLKIYNVTQFSTAALTGIFTSYCIEMLLNWRHCHIPTTIDHPHTFVYMNLIGDGVHNFIDGMVIAGAFQINFKLGLITSIAIILHEIPQEIGDFGVIVYGGVSTKNALVYNLISGATAIFGAIISLSLSSYIVGIYSFLIPFAFGNFIYIAGSDLVPEIRDEKNLSKGFIQLFFMITGAILLYLLRFIE